MKPAATLKEILKPPFTCNQFGAVDLGHRIWVNVINHIQFYTPEEADAFNAELFQFVTQALNEKWERDFGEPLRWNVNERDTGLLCPKCDGYTGMLVSKFCPHCGRRLLPPKETNNGTGK